MVKTTKMILYEPIEYRNSDSPIATTNSSTFELN
jgi:hypothetical protein